MLKLEFTGIPHIETAKEAIYDRLEPVVLESDLLKQSQLSVQAELSEQPRFSGPAFKVSVTVHGGPLDGKRWSRVSKSLYVALSELSEEMEMTLAQRSKNRTRNAAS